MDNTLLINKYILSFLENSTSVTTILGTDAHKIFPLIQPDNLSFPYIVFQRTSVIPSYTKDVFMGGGYGWTNTVSVIIKCVSNDYVESAELANAVRNTLEGSRYMDNDIKIDSILLTSASEYSVESDVFVQELTFEISAE